MSTSERRPEVGFATCVIVTQNDKVLLSKRLSGARRGYWGLPGGRAGESESLEDAARRELEEETGLQAPKTQAVGVVREFQNDQAPVDFVHFVFFTNDFSGAPILMEPEKCEGWEWFLLDNPPANTVPSHRHALEGYATFKSTEAPFIVDAPRDSA